MDVDDRQRSGVGSIRRHSRAARPEHERGNTHHTTTAHHPAVPPRLALVAGTADPGPGAAHATEPGARALAGHPKTAGGMLVPHRKAVSYTSLDKPIPESLRVYAPEPPCACRRAHCRTRRAARLPLRSNGVGSRLHASASAFNQTMISSGLCGRVPIKRSPAHNPLHGLGHVQSRTAQWCVQQQHPVTRTPTHKLWRGGNSGRSMKGRFKPICRCCQRVRWTSG